MGRLLRTVPQRKSQSEDDRWRTKTTRRHSPQRLARTRNQSLPIQRIQKRTRMISQRSVSNAPERRRRTLRKQEMCPQEGPHELPPLQRLSHLHTHRISPRLVPLCRKQLQRSQENRPPETPRRGKRTRQRGAST